MLLLLLAIYIVMGTTTANVCEQVPAKGPCSGNFRRFYYNPILKKCLPFAWGGCKGTQNNFRTSQDCMKKCGAQNVCNLPAVSGACLGPMENRWFWDANIQDCRQFSWSCGGNKNNFVTRAACLNQCDGRRRRKPSPPPGPNVCILKPVKGNCGGAEAAWFWDVNAGKCRPFVYTGCILPNQNRFATKKACMKTCGPTKGFLFAGIALAKERAFLSRQALFARQQALKKLAAQQAHQQMLWMKNQQLKMNAWMKVMNKSKKLKIKIQLMMKMWKKKNKTKKEKKMLFLLLQDIKASLKKKMKKWQKTKKKIAKLMATLIKKKLLKTKRGKKLLKKYNSFKKALLAAIQLQMEVDRRLALISSIMAQSRSLSSFLQNVPLFSNHKIYLQWLKWVLNQRKCIVKSNMCISCTRKCNQKSGLCAKWKCPMKKCLMKGAWKCRMWMNML